MGEPLEVLESKQVRRFLWQLIKKERRGIERGIEEIEKRGQSKELMPYVQRNIEECRIVQIG